MAAQNRFLSQLETSPENTVAPEKLQETNRFLGQLKGREIPKTEGIGKATSRTFAQVPLGLAKRFTWPADLLSLFGQGEALAGINELDDERIAELKEKFPTAPWENFQGLDQSKMLESLQAAASIFPTQGNIEHLIEKKTGLPLEPKNALQKTIRLGSTAAGFRPGGAAPKITAAVTAPAAKKVAEIAGVPEPLAEGLGLLASSGVPTPSISTKVKPSGLITRRFEKLEKPTTVSSARHEKISEAVEQDFKKISEKIFSENKTYSAIKEDPLFKEKISNLFDKVDTLAKDVKGYLSPDLIRSNLRNKALQKMNKGISPNEYEKAYRKEIKSILKEIGHRPLTASKGVDQFRKNNSSLGEYFEPGKSSAYNSAKRDALLDYNRSIEESFSKTYPNTEFEKLFKFTNNRWKEISDVESAEEFINKVFDGKINYKQAKLLFNNDKEHIARPFKRLLGDKGFKDFKALTEDLLSSEKAYSMLKKAGTEGNKDLLQLGAEYIIHPKIAATHGTAKLAKRLYQASLDKPQIAIEWKKALDALKKGNFDEAEKGFRNLDKQAKSLNQSSK